MRKYQVRFRGGITEKGLLLPRRYPTRHLGRPEAGAGPAHPQSAPARRRAQQGQPVRGKHPAHLAGGRKRQADPARLFGPLHAGRRGLYRL